MEAQGVFHTEERFVEIRRQIKEQDRRLLEMGIEISTPKTIHYFVSVCGVERELKKLQRLPVRFELRYQLLN